MAKASNAERQRVSEIHEKLVRMRDARLNYSNRWDEYDRVWKMFREDRTGEDAWRANLTDTWSFATIKTAQAAFVDSKVMPVIRGHEDDDQMKARDLKDLYVDISNKGKLDLELYYARLDSFKYGMGFIKTVYIRDDRTVRAIQKFDPFKDEITYKEENLRDFDDPKTIRVSPRLILVDEMTRGSIENARYLAEIEILGYDDAKRVYSHFFKGGEKEFEERIPKSRQSSGLSEITGENKVATIADDNTRDKVDLFQSFAP
ncbi:hypothetical protein LCGC14_2850920, partial [marine sediment metagenome]